MKKHLALRFKILCSILVISFVCVILTSTDPTTLFVHKIKYSFLYRFIKETFFSLSMEENLAIWRESVLPNSIVSDTITPRIIVLPVFSLLTDPSYSLFNKEEHKPNRSRLEARMADFTESVQYSLDHPHVASVHIMFDQDAMPQYMLKRVGPHPKLKFERVRSAYVVGEILEFIHVRFRNELVLLTNGDVYPGEGFEYVNYDFMKRKRLFYTPSRHGRQEKRCSAGQEHCDKGGRYMESHDTYIFIPTEPFPADAKAVMKDIVWDSFGAENVLLFVYHSILKYKVLNPCYVIFMYHNHCSRLRHSNRRQYLNITRYYDAEPSSELV